MLNLTREQTIIEHRKMWNWLADQYEAGRYVGKSDYFKENGYDRGKIPIAYCFCCDYTTRGDCYYCPIKWSNNPHSSCVENKNSLYNRFSDLIVDERHLKKLSKIARKIANLPEKEGMIKMEFQIIDSYGNVVDKNLSYEEALMYIENTAGEHYIFQPMKGED